MSSLAIASALVEWRRGDPAFVALGGACYAVTDPAAQSTAPLKAVLYVTVGPSETRACVPIQVREEVSASEGARLDLFVDCLERAWNGKAHFSSACVINRMMRGSTRFDDGPGIAARATIEWTGLASWR